MIDRLDYFLSTVDDLLDTRRKRHLFGGFLMSMSFLFGGMAITVITVRDETKQLRMKRENDYFPENLR